ncbi:hypothetical protein GWI33_019196 [Rhynchophorus ferrugineus]|uniref:Uncharacterized protein n=1 Tax=Rhynchophorus ferrugineus TaxID=354439 RepID=A0A834M1L0_RHYFE|nr:hypothetical protein GWI33_019196 [Rhynchophorus ferrugineus]
MYNQQRVAGYQHTEFLRTYSCFSYSGNTRKRSIRRRGRTIKKRRGWRKTQKTRMRKATMHKGGHTSRLRHRRQLDEHLNTSWSRLTAKTSDSGTTEPFYTRNFTWEMKNYIATHHDESMFHRECNCN